MDSEHKTPRVNLANVVAYGLIIITLVKMVVVTSSNPIWGYANSYDFNRQSSCIGLWQSDLNKQRIVANPEAPVNSLYFDGDRQPWGCMKSIDNVFPYLSTVFHQIGDQIDFREVSFWKEALVSICAVVLLVLIRNPIIKMAISTAFFLVFGDIVNLLYLNTLYFDFSVIFSCFLSMSLVAMLIAMKKFPNRYIVLFSAFSLVWLGLSKQQYMPLASALSLIFSLFTLSRYGFKKATYLFLLISLSLPIAYGLLNRDHHGSMKNTNFANNTDTFMWAVLPEAEDKETALSVLGLPVSCLSAIGKSWYSPGLQQNHPCPEVERLSRIRLIKLFLMEPSTFFRPMFKMISDVRPFYPSTLGRFENPADSNTIKYALIAGTSFSTLFTALPLEVHAWLALTSFVSGPLFIFLLAVGNKFSRRDNTEVSRVAFAMIGLGGIETFYTIASSVFGDGYAEPQKHAVAFLIGIVFQLVGAVFALLSAWLDYDKPENITHPDGENSPDDSSDQSLTNAPNMI